MSDVPVTVSRTKVSSIEALRDAVQDAPMNIVQLEPGKMTGTLTHLSVGTIGISHGAFSRGVRSRGVLSERRWALGMVLDAPAMMQHFKMAPGDIVTVAPDYEGYARYYGANHYAAMFIEPDELFVYLESQQPGAAEAAVWQRSTSVPHTDAAAAAVRAATFRRLLAAISSEGPTMSAGSVEFFRREILRQMTAPILHGVDYREPRSRQSETTLVRKVERYLVDAGTRPVHITELVEKFEVHERKLFRAFKDQLGIGPITFNRNKRFGDVLAVLLRGGPDQMIKDIAKEHGFLDYPRFTREYRQLFGERPSQTLRRGRRWQQKGAK